MRHEASSTSQYSQRRLDRSSKISKSRSLCGNVGQVGPFWETTLTQLLLLAEQFRSCLSWSPQTHPLPSDLWLSNNFQDRALFWHSDRTKESQAGRNFMVSCLQNGICVQNAHKNIVLTSTESLSIGWSWNILEYLGCYQNCYQNCYHVVKMALNVLWQPHSPQPSFPQAIGSGRCDLHTLESDGPPKVCPSELGSIPWVGQSLLPLSPQISESRVTCFTLMAFNSSK